MKLAVVIPTCNAEKRGIWKEVLEAAAAQKLGICRKVVIDSSSDDATCSMAKSYGWQCQKIRRETFNHGLTRNAAVQALAAEGFDTVVFLSQDVVLSTPDTLLKLTGFLWSHPIAGCYGRQRSAHEHSLNAWQRQHCYPEKSAVKTRKDVPKSGLMALFFSDAFAAWKISEVLQYGGFPETDFGEDMLLAARILQQGGAVGYCAEAVACHDHANTLRALFSRGQQIGTFHRQHPELLRQFGGRNTGHAMALPPVSMWLPLGIKILGYVWGRLPECRQHDRADDVKNDQ